MDMRSLMNRAKTRFRYYLASDLKIKKIIPASFRHRISGRVMDALETHTDVPAPYEPGRFPWGLNLYGFFKAENGLAQGVKLYAGALEQSGVPYAFLNTDFLDWLPQEDTTFDDRLVKENPYAVNVIHVNPDQWQEACGMFPREQFDRHYNIGVWLWELETIPDHWLPMLDYVDEVWVPSRFIGQALKKVTEKPVTVIPYGIDAPADENLTRADFDLREEDFLVLMMYDSNSYTSRKNPAAAIRAFREAFGEKPEHARLVIKISNPKPEDLALMEMELKPGTYHLITERMSRTRLNSLIRLCDVYVSLHRAEGFGLVIAEAMKLGTSVVATNWSANTEFMPADASCPVDCQLVPVKGAYQFDNGSMRWAEPDEHQAAAYLKRLRDDPAWRREKAGAGQKYISEHFSSSVCAERIRARMEEIRRGS